MLTRVIVALVALVLAATTGGPAHAASISNVYFSSGSVPPGQTFRSEGELPGPTKTFESGKDNVARLYVVLRDMSAHTFGGELKGPGGKVVRKLNWNVQSFNRAAAWRFVTYSFNLKNLEPGEYSIDLTVDDAPAGTYGFSLK
jgi:hypothetical protein